MKLDSEVSLLIKSRYFWYVVLTVCLCGWILLSAFGCSSSQAKPPEVFKPVPLQAERSMLPTGEPEKTLPADKQDVPSKAQEFDRALLIYHTLQADCMEFSDIPGAPAVNNNCIRAALKCADKVKPEMGMEAVGMLIECGQKSRGVTE